MRRSFSEGDAEGSALAEIGMADEELAFVVLFNDTFGEAEAEAPAAFFCGEAGFEDFLQISGGDTLASVCDIYEDLFFEVLDRDGDGACSFHGIQSVL